MSRSICVLGISAFVHDSAAALVRDGEIVAAVEEERFTRKRHDASFPLNAINYCLEAGQFDARELAAIAFYESPVRSLDRKMRSPFSCPGDRALDWAAPEASRIIGGLALERIISEKLRVDLPVLFSDHIFAHAASAYFPSPFGQAAVLHVDGVGEWATTALGSAKDAVVEIQKEIEFPHSLGLLYSAFAQFCGFEARGGEAQLMELAAIGKPVYVEAILDRLIDVKTDGSFRLKRDLFDSMGVPTGASSVLSEIFGGPARDTAGPLTRRELELAASIQLVVEEVTLRLCRTLRELTGMDELCVAGELAHNCALNGEIKRRGPFDRVWIQPASGNAGGALGAALMVTHGYFGVPRPERRGRASDRQNGSCLGPSYSNAEVRAFLCRNDYPFQEVTDAERARLVARCLAEGKIVGYMVGRMEFGPRSLGSRSILADARRKEVKARINLKVKFREVGRPLAASVICERLGDYFDLRGDSPYMQFVVPVCESQRVLSSAVNDSETIAGKSGAQSLLPAVTHADYRALVQTVQSDTRADFHQVLRQLEAITGTAVVANTSFNVANEPIVCTPRDAYVCFMRGDIDLLVIENCVLYKDAQPSYVETENWRDRYGLKR